MLMGFWLRTILHGVIGMKLGSKREVEAKRAEATHFVSLALGARSPRNMQIRHSHQWF